LVAVAAIQSTSELRQVQTLVEPSSAASGQTASHLVLMSIVLVAKLQMLSASNHSMIRQLTAQM
jgi:hypothetical protein